MEIDDPTTPITSIVPADNHEPLASEEQPNKRRRKKSIVWEHFTIETVGAGCMRAICKQCKKSFAYITGSKLAGTSHLKRHIALGICPVSRQKNEASPCTPGSKTDQPKRRYRASPGFASIPFDQNRHSHEIAKMIIQHEYPLHIVEHPAFIDFVRTLQPQYSMVSFNTIQGECVGIYLREKQSLLNLISGIPGRVSITLDLGTSNLNLGYAFLTGHFIDGNWNLHRRILNVVILPFPDSDYAFNQAVVSCLSDWHLESKLFTLTLDQSFSSETILGNLRGLLSVRNPLVLGGQLLKGNCYARVLSRLAKDAITSMGETVRVIRESVKYVKTSESHDEQFGELRQQLQVPSTKDLIIDDQTKWNTTYQMLVAACELKEVFACLDTSDPVYKINPSIEDWKQVEMLCTYLKLFFDAAIILTGPTYPSANAFYHEMSKIQLELTHAATSPDPFVSNLTKPLKEKFDQYWKECFLVLAVAVVMDPRFKMKLVEFSFSRIFGEDAGMWIKMVDDGVHELFLEYLVPNLSLPAPFLEEGNLDISQSEASQEVVLIPAQDGPSEELPPQELHPEEVHLEVVHPGEAGPEEEQPQQITLQEEPQQEKHHQEFALQETHHQEVPPPEVTCQDIPPQDMHTQEAPPEAMHTDEVPPEEMDHQGVPPQEMHSQGVPCERETHGQGVPSEQETHSQGVPCEQETCSQKIPPEHGVPPEQEMHTEEVPPEQEMHTEEVPPEQEMHTEEVPSEQETDHQAVLPQEMHTQEVLPEQEMHSQEVTPQEMDHQRLAAQEMDHEAVLPQEMDPEGITHQEMHTQEVPPREMDHQGLAVQEMNHEAVLPQEMDPEGVSHQVMHTQEVPAEEMHIQEVPLQDMCSQGLSQEIQPQEVHPQGLPLLSTGDGLSDFDVYLSEITSSQHMKSELDQYLEESLLPRVQDFDLLGWWKLNKLKYPTLSKMAADILSTPVSTVTPDSVFDTEAKKIDSYRSSLRPVTLEALVCAKDWLQYGSSSSSSTEIPNAIVKMEY